MVQHAYSQFLRGEITEGKSKYMNIYKGDSLTRITPSAYTQMTTTILHYAGSLFYLLNKEDIPASPKVTSQNVHKLVST